MSSRISSHFGLHGLKTDPGLETERLLLRALLLAVTSLWPHQVGSRNEIYSARWKLTPISDQAKDLRSVHTRRQVAATRRGDRSLRVYRSGD